MRIDADALDRFERTVKRHARRMGIEKVTRGPDGTPIIHVNTDKMEGRMTTATSAEPVTLESLREGAAEALFLEQLNKAVANIMDERTDPGKPRRVVLTVELRPFVSESTVIREKINVNVAAESKLAAIESGREWHTVKRDRSGYQLVLPME